MRDLGFEKIGLYAMRSECKWHQAVLIAESSILLNF